jgi:hypothetical protein
MDHEYGGVPPVTMNVSEYGAAIVAGGSDWFTIDGPGSIDSVNVLWADAPPASVACTVKVEEPALFGAPVKAPADERDRPAGRTPAATVHV